MKINRHTNIATKQPEHNILKLGHFLSFEVEFAGHEDHMLTSNCAYRLVLKSTYSNSRSSHKSVCNDKYL